MAKFEIVKKTKSEIFIYGIIGLIIIVLSGILLSTT